MVRGRISVQTPQGARNLLAQQGLAVTDLKQVRESRFGSGRKRRLAVMHFVRQLASFVEADVPVQCALEALGKQSRRAELRLAVQDVTARVSQGEALSVAFSAHPKVFPAFMANVIRASEKTGDLAKPLNRLSHYLERDVDSRRDVRQALQYPAMVVLLGFMAAMVMVFFVFPQLQAGLRILRVQLPDLPARVFQVGDFIRANALVLAIGAGAILVALAVWSRSASGRGAMVRAGLRGPLVRDILAAAAVEQASRLTALMIGSGVPVPDALDVAAIAARYDLYRTALQYVRTQVLDGESMAVAFEDSGVFPPAAVEMVRAGVDSGRLTQQLDNCADFYEKELMYYIKRLTALVEPFALIVLGVAVTFFGIIIIVALYGSLVQIGKPF